MRTVSKTIPKPVSKPACSRRNTVEEAGKTGFFLAFLIPFLFWMAVFALRGVSPFGPLSLNSMDGYGQYYPMLENMSRAWREGSPLYSFNGGLGFNLWAQNAYYTNSPLWWLLYALPQGWHIAAIDLLTALRLSLAGLGFYAWLHGSGREGLPAVLGLSLSCAYALSAYMVAFINQFMWADVTALLPAVTLGLHRLIRQGKPVLYTFTLFLSLWSCFYIGYMVCLFLSLYFLLLMLEERRAWAERLQSLGRFALYSLLAAGMAAIVLLPAYEALQKTIASGMGFEGGLRWYHPLRELLARFLPFGKIALAYEAPNLYCGVTTLALAFLFLVNSRIPLRRRLWRLALLLLLFISLNLNLADYIWHGFHYPNQLPGRESFLLIFLLLTTAGDGAACFGRHGRAGDGAACLERREPAAGAARPAALVCSLLLMSGSMLNAGYQFLTQTWVASNASLLAQDGQMAALLEAAEADAGRVSDEPPSFYRLEWSDPAKLNPGQQYGYAGVTWYSSTMPADAYYFFERLGLPVYAARVSTKYVRSDILDALFSIRYVLEDGQVRENPDVLPLAFLTGGEALDFNMEESGETGPDLQRRLWEAVSGGPEEELSGQVRRLNGQGLRISRWEGTYIAGEIDCPGDGVLFTTLPDDGGWRIRIDAEEIPVETACGYLCAARIGAGHHAVEFCYEPPGFAAGRLLSAVCLLVFLSISAGKRAYEKLKKSL